MAAPLHPHYLSGACVDRAKPRTGQMQSERLPLWEDVSGANRRLRQSSSANGRGRWQCSSAVISALRTFASRRIHKQPPTKSVAADRVATSPSLVCPFEGTHGVVPAHFDLPISRLRTWRVIRWNVPIVPSSRDHVPRRRDTGPARRGDGRIAGSPCPELSWSVQRRRLLLIRTIRAG